MLLAVFASGGGSNFQAIQEKCRVGELSSRIAVVISNDPQAGVAQKAAKEGIPFECLNSKDFADIETFSDVILGTLERYQIDMIILAGYIKKMPAKVIQQYPRHILNIHPALLPKFGGKGMYGFNVHQAVVEAGEKVSGPTIHLVNNQYDQGRILAQVKVPVYPLDTAQDLASRVLKEEHALFWRVIKQIENGEIDGVCYGRSLYR